MRSSSLGTGRTEIFCNRWHWRKLAATLGGMLCGILLCSGCGPASVELRPQQDVSDLKLPLVLQAEGIDQLLIRDLRGTAIVLELWATWCGPCIANIDHWNEVHDACHDLPVQFISVSNEDEETVREFVAGKPIRGWLGVDPESTFLRALKVSGIPLTVLISAEGRVVAKISPRKLNRELVEQLISTEDLGMGS